jgi:hypothetical protein
LKPAAFKQAPRIGPAAFAFGLLLAAAGASCGVSKTISPPGGGGGGAAAAGGSGGPEATACLDRPTDLPRPPTGTLPCELLPPGFSR